MTPLGMGRKGHYEDSQLRVCPESEKHLITAQMCKFIWHKTLICYGNRLFLEDNWDGITGKQHL